MSNEKRFGTKEIGALVLVGAILGAVVIVKTKPKAMRKPMSSMIPVVQTAPLTQESTREMVQCLGTVIAEDEAVLEAEVSGRITMLSPALVEGALVRKGDPLLAIDARDYELAKERAEAALLTAQSALRLEEGQQSVAQHEMELIGSASPVDPAYRDLMLRTPQLKSAQANLKTAQANVAAAQLDLERTQVRAPFDGVVRSVDVSVGDQARSGKTLLTLTASARFFVQGSLPVRSLEAFPELGTTSYSATIQLADGALREGVLYQILPDLSAQGRMARLLVAVENPLATTSGRPLLLDEVVHVELAGRPLDGVCRIDRKYWRDGAVVWMVDAEKNLKICPATLVQGYATEVLVRVDFSPEWALVVSDIPAPVEGMPVRIQGANATEPSDPEKGAPTMGARKKGARK